MLHYIKWISHRKLVSAGLNSERTAAYLTSLPETLIFRHEILIQGYLLRAKVIYKAKQVKLLGHTMLFINLIRTKRKNILYFVPVEFLSDCTQAQNTQLGHSGMIDIVITDPLIHKSCFSTVRPMHLYR